MSIYTVLCSSIYFVIYFTEPSNCIDGDQAKHDDGIVMDGSLTSSRRLHHSTHAEISEYPYVASVLKHGKHWCGGALITSQLVITTANCVWRSGYISPAYISAARICNKEGGLPLRENDYVTVELAANTNIVHLRSPSQLLINRRHSIDEMSIRLGSSTPRSGGQEMYIKDIKRHPLWNISTDPYCDLAVIKMEKEVMISSTLQTAELPNVNLFPKYNDVWVTGFGTEKADGMFPSDEVRLQVYQAELLDHAECRDKMELYHVNLSTTFFCLSQLDEKGPCTRDTGSPAVSQGVVWGLASWGIRRKCGTRTLPAMFTYLGAAENMEFIQSTTVEWQAIDATREPWFYE